MMCWILSSTALRSAGLMLARSLSLRPIWARMEARICCAGVILAQAANCASGLSGAAAAGLPPIAALNCDAKSLPLAFLPPPAADADAAPLLLLIADTFICAPCVMLGKGD